MKRLLFAVTIALVALSLNSAPVAAQAVGNTDVDITLPDIVILHYYSNVDLAIDSTAMGNFLVGSGGDSSYDEGTSAPGGGGLTFDLNIGPSALTGDPSNATLVLVDSWAVRSLSLAGATNTQLVISVGAATLDHVSTTASMDITGAIVDDGASSGTTITFPATGLYNPRIGNVELTLDMTDAVNAGVYADGSFTLTASNI